MTNLALACTSGIKKKSTYEELTLINKILIIRYLTSNL